MTWAASCIIRVISQAVQFTELYHFTFFSRTDGSSKTWASEKKKKFNGESVEEKDAGTTEMKTPSVPVWFWNQTGD